jgi:hypothetical protein
MGMAERHWLLDEIAELSERRATLMAVELQRHAAFMAEDDPVHADRIAVELEDICGEIEEISDKIRRAQNRIEDEFEAPESRRVMLWDAAYLYGMAL